MLVMQPVRGAFGATFTSPRTPSMVVPGNAAAIARARAEVGNGLTASPMGGLGAIPAIPDWAIWAAGGLAAGAVVGFVVWKRKRKG